MTSSPRLRVPVFPRLRWVAVALVVFLAGMVPWWVIWLIEPRPNGVMFGIAEAVVGLREFTPALLVSILWVNGAIFASELACAGLVAYRASSGNLKAGWLWGVAIGLTSILTTFVDPIFLNLMPEVPGRVRVWPEEPTIVYLLRDVMLMFHLFMVVVLPQLGGVLGALAARRWDSMHQQAETTHR